MPREQDEVRKMRIKVAVVIGVPDTYINWDYEKHQAKCTCGCALLLHSDDIQHSTPETEAKWKEMHEAHSKQPIVKGPKPLTVEDVRAEGNLVEKVAAFQRTPGEKTIENAAPKE